MRSQRVIKVKRSEKQKERVALIEGIARGERAIREGRTLTEAQAKQRLARWLK